MLFPTTPFIIFFLIVFPLSWLLLPLRDSKKDWTQRLPWKVMILVASYIFLGFNQPLLHFGPVSIPLPCAVLISSIVMNYCFTNLMMRQSSQRAKSWILGIAISANVGALAYFKYRNFIIGQAHNVLGDAIGLPRLSSLIIPIAISFFTFQAISYLVDCYRGTFEKVTILDLAVYLSYFPHLVAGPIVRASEFIPQMRNRINPRAVEGTHAATLIARGLFKKMIVADLLYTQIVRPAFGAPGELNSIDAIAAIYAYAAQLYCDFSGYTDIAIGIALLLGFKFPENFNRPYTATSLRDFWQRWHMTLSRWLRDYVYIPLGGNKKSIFGARLVGFNLLATMTIGGLWHGANATFVVWGMYIGIFMVVERWIRSFNERHNIAVPAWFRRFLTFNIISFGWIIFASESLSNVRIMLGRVFTDLSAPSTLVSFTVIVLILCGIFIQSIPQNLTSRVSAKISAQPIYAQAVIFGCGLLLLSAMSGQTSAFVYGFF